MLGWCMPSYEGRPRRVRYYICFPCERIFAPSMFLCHQTSRPRIVLDGWDVISSPYRDKTFAEYEAAAERCEFWRSVDRRHYMVLKRRLLQYDKRTCTGSSRGLALVEDYPPLELKKGDRVEVIAGAIDCQGFYAVVDFPVDICFWRPSMETVTHHRNPTFSEETDITPLRCTALDWLHVLSFWIFRALYIMPLIASCERMLVPPMMAIWDAALLRV